MRRTLLPTLALPLLLASGCVAVPPPPPRPLPAPLIAPGRPPFEPGAPESYWIWHDGAGWHLRTTTAGYPHRFHGAVLPLGGTVLEARPLRGDEPERVRVGPGGITFDLVTQGGADGFDWRVSSGCNRFELYVDGAARPGLVRLGGPAHSPRRIPFDRCP